MELACDIVRKKTNVYNITNTLKKIKSIGLKDPNLIQDKNIADRVNLILKSIIDCNDDIGDALITAYYISTHTINELHDNNIKDQRLINAANSLVSCIENSEKKYLEDVFFDCMDNYYSLYKMSKSSSEISEIELLFNELEEKIKIHLLLSKKKQIIKKSKFTIIKKMFNINPMISTKKLLSSYKLISRIPYLCNIIWKEILDNMNNNIYNREHLFIIMVAELRIMMVPKLNNTSDRKKLYYMIDIENIIQSIRNRSLSISNVLSIISIFDNKYTIPSCEIWDNYFDKCIVDFFHTHFDTLYLN